MVSPPTDYPQQEDHQLASSARESAVETSPITVRSVLDRLDSNQPVTEAMIHTAVTNLHIADTLKNYKTTVALHSQSQKKPTFVPTVLRSLLKNVRRG